MANTGHGLHQDLTAETIAEAVQVCADYFRRGEGLSLKEADRVRITRDLVARYDGVRADDITRRSLTDELLRAFQALLDAKHMAEIGAVPIAEGKLHPIEDEL